VLHKSASAKACGMGFGKAVPKEAAAHSSPYGATASSNGSPQAVNRRPAQKGVLPEGMIASQRNKG
jgi:hypothetical protein